jgi:purine-binding chemotaxis protein CheW
MKNSITNTVMGETHYIVFSVKDQSFCLPVQNVRSILKVPRTFPVPQAPAYIMGVVNVDGNVIPLINATLKLNMGDHVIPENPTMLVLELQAEDGKMQLLGLHVDDVKDVIECNDHELRPLPTSRYEFDERLADGVFHTHDDFIMKLNVTNFFKHNLDDLNPELTLTTH